MNHLEKILYLLVLIFIILIASNVQEAIIQIIISVKYVMAFFVRFAHKNVINIMPNVHYAMKDLEMNSKPLV